MEEVDNPGYDNLSLSYDYQFGTTWEGDLLRGVTTITATCEDQQVKLIPYYAWDNRTPGKMQVWIPFADK